MMTAPLKDGAPVVAPDLGGLAYQFAAQVVHAMQECDPALRETAEGLLADLVGDLDDDEAFATRTLIAEILFPNSDPKDCLGLDLEEAEAIARKTEPAAAPVPDGMDRQEATFADRLRALMDKHDVTQAALAAKIGVGQPAISNMLSRTCRPQRKTVQKIADALGVEREYLWPARAGAPICI